MDTLSRLNSLLQSLRHAPAHFTITSETIFSVRLSLGPATMKLITSDPYLSARVNSALKKGAKDRNRGAAKRKAASEVVGALESLVKNGNVKVGSSKSPLNKTRNAIDMRRKTAKAKLKSTLDDVSSEGSSADDEEEDTEEDTEEEDMKEEEEEEDGYTNCSEKEDGESSCARDDATTRSSMRRAASTATVTSQKVFSTAMPVPNKKRKRGMTEAECTEERRRKDARRA